MNSRLERSNSTATQFPGDIRLDEQRDVTPPAIVSPKRITGRDEPQASKLRKRRHERQSESGIPNNDIDGVGFITLPPRLPPKLKAHESLFVSHESPSPEEQVFLPVKRASPWEYYNKIYRRELGGSVVVASKIPATFELFVVKSIAGLDVDDKAQVLRQVRHENLLACYEIFGLHDAIFIVSEYMAISLTDLNGSAVPPSETQIATIIHQVLAGLDFLATQNMMHGGITCSNILLSLRGDVRIANPEGCILLSPGSPEIHEDTKSLGFVMLQLMERGSSRRERLALEHPEKWSLQADKFLQSTASSPAKQLLSHAFLKNSPRKAELVSMVGCAQTSSYMPFCLEAP